ncbi:DUF4832 domain-containing protein [Stenotrophomonas sp. 24(2023)]|uniref:DUF4832 domain-containing protein n=1 Tax=Stenotrophomonas sp. 24(2023) TaxID=3068324 RepID=UPI0027E1757A|nr:DUF4832 domain-containing protein [Stenotrophomonas sp. 24(2023)]WMJ70825.1 DUF4832 domain-containing protein [Stenotrophomonas sp. 24(2023)]
MKTHALPLALALFAACTTLPPTAHAGSISPAVSNQQFDNPHRGFMLWGSSYAANGGVDNFHGAHIYHVYLPWRVIETADQVFDWQAVETHYLQPILADDPLATFVLRPVADYPDSAGSQIDAYYTGGENERDYPKFLEQAPLSIPFAVRAKCDGDGPIRSLDYNHPAARQQMQQFVQALAQRFDGDPRITAIQVGLLGFWGEWHTSGCEDLQPNSQTRSLIRDAYVAAFKRTPLQTRYARQSDIGTAAFGIYEDYFPSFTAKCTAFSPALPSCSDTGWWNLEYAFTHEAPAARQNWKINPISGESPNTNQKNTWTQRTADVRKLLRDYHFSFLGPAGAHEKSGNAASMQQIKRDLGYRLAVTKATWPDVQVRGQQATLQLSVGNSGSAPLYQGYHVELHWVASNGTTAARTSLADIDLNAVMPGETTQHNSAFTVPAGLSPGSYALRLAFADDAPGRRHIAPQNDGQDAERRLVLGQVQVQ